MENHFWFDLIFRNRIMDTLSSPIQMLSFLKRAEPESQEISRAAEIWETTLQIVKERIHQKHKRSINATGNDI